ncbi:hypothetical protein J7T55_012872 [Diaporthe amygdali]|uniref:uncharacterized protein n=1 Tax=Phomopsis amygdali TaxID=1214568 RepID=UPI0022FE336C|nr:uncharacterized protein J7T55_012872 [Diaporthe amygdali]KAJ0118620.1 hypothetical protein J7T55_012872 [Diaporthe amygdali]
MDESSKQKMSFTSVPKDNQALTADIQDFIQKQRNPDVSLESGTNQSGKARAGLEVLLERLYLHICKFGGYEGSAATPDKKILAAWQSFLGPINALTGIESHGYMIAARMTLYLTQAFRQSGQLPRTLPISASSSKPIALRCNFLISLDDRLLSCLAHIWSQSDKREMFTWVFTDYPVHVCGCRHGGTCQDFVSPGKTVMEFHEQRKRDHIKAACITDPSNLTPENGVRPRWRWTRTEGDTAHYPRHPDSSRAGYDESTDRERMLMWQEIGSDGPIRESYYYTLEDEDTGETHGRDRAALRRSRQFILDARKLAECNIARDSRGVAQVEMAKRSLPAELQTEVFEYLDEIRDHPYLGGLDLSAIYRPFPDISKKCSHCTGRANNSAEKMAKSTCPLNSITIWSLPMRVFHTFHQLNGGKWQLCSQIDCTGHHSDASWRLRNGVTFEDYLNSIIRIRCGPDLTITDIGLGPLDPVQLPTQAEDRARERRLFSGQWDDYEAQDRRDEARWTGIAGLVSVMMHNKTLIGLHNSGRATTDPSWLFGRTRQDEARAGSALASDHVHCEYC